MEPIFALTHSFEVWCTSIYNLPASLWEWSWTDWITDNCREFDGYFQSIKHHYWNKLMAYIVFCLVAILKYSFCFNMYCASSVEAKRVLSCLFIHRSLTAGISAMLRLAAQGTPWGVNDRNNGNQNHKAHTFLLLQWRVTANRNSRPHKIRITEAQIYFNRQQRWAESHFQTPTPVLFQIFEYSPDPGPKIFQIWESDSYSDSGNHRCNRNSAMLLLKQWYV